MTEQEAQQAQTIKRIGEMLNTPWGNDVGAWVANCEDLREIVDSQSQKIAHLEHKRTRAFQICHANIKWQREQRKLQAQKIVELERENLYLKRQADIHNTLMADGAKFILENKAKIAEHAKEIERLKDCMFQHMDSDTYNHCQEYLEKMRGKNENRTANETHDLRPGNERAKTISKSS